MGAIDFLKTDKQIYPESVSLKQTAFMIFKKCLVSEYSMDFCSTRLIFLFLSVCFLVSSRKTHICLPVKDE